MEEQIGLTAIPAVTGQYQDQTPPSLASRSLLDARQLQSCAAGPVIGMSVAYALPFTEQLDAAQSECWGPHRRNPCFLRKVQMRTGLIGLLPDNRLGAMDSGVAWEPWEAALACERFLAQLELLKASTA